MVVFIVYWSSFFYAIFVAIIIIIIMMMLCSFVSMFLLLFIRLDSHSCFYSLFRVCAYVVKSMKKEKCAQITHWTNSELLLLLSNANNIKLIQIYWSNFAQFNKYFSPRAPSLHYYLSTDDFLIASVQQRQIIYIGCCESSLAFPYEMHFQSICLSSRLIIIFRSFLIRGIISNFSFW